MNITNDFIGDGLFKVAVVGSREITDESLVFDYLDSKIDKIGLIVSGAARGIDKMARSYCEKRGLPILEFYPKWRDKNGIYNNGAGFQRNKLIVKEADVIVAFHLNSSTGTQHSIDLGRQYGKQVIVLTVEPVFQTIVKEERF